MTPLQAWWPTLLFGAILVVAYTVAPEEESLVDGVVNSLIYSTFSITGGWIVLRSRNGMGRLFQVLAVASVSLFLTESYLGASLTGERGLPEGSVDLAMVWANNLLFVPFFLLNFVLPFFLFPTGRPASRRWGYAVHATWIWGVVVSLALVVAPVVEMDDQLGGDVANPWAVEALAAPASFLSDQVFNVISLLGLIAVASLVFRYRAGGTEQRAQIRWFLLAGVFLIFSLVLDEVVLDAVALDMPVLEGAIELAVLLVGLLGLPVATTVAILKYRLYEVDVVINKTLVYGSLTLVLAALYAGLVVGLQRLLPTAASDSDFTVAAATLAVAGAFRPLRARLQALIDRSFYRRRYDVSATLGDFAAHVRDQVDLDSLSDELVRVVGSTMQPAHASLWLRPEVQS